VDPAKRPASVPSVELLGDVGDPSPAQAVASVARVAQEAIWQAPAQNERRVTNEIVSDIAMIPCDLREGWSSRRVGKNEALCSGGPFRVIARDADYDSG
jgi:hypothetical protein